MTWFHTDTYGGTLSERSVFLCPTHQPHPPNPADFVALTLYKLMSSIAHVIIATAIRDPTYNFCTILCFYVNTSLFYFLSFRSNCLFFTIYLYYYIIIFFSEQS